MFKDFDFEINDFDFSGAADRTFGRVTAPTGDNPF